MSIKRPAWFNRFKASIKRPPREQCNPIFRSVWRDDRLTAMLQRPPGRWSNGLAIAATVLTFLSLLTPGSLQVVPIGSSFKTLLAMPLHLLLYSQLGGLVGLIMLPLAPLFVVEALLTVDKAGAWFAVLFFLTFVPPVFWMLLSWNWCARAAAQLWGWFRTPLEHRRPVNMWTRRWLTAPLLAIALYGLWFTQLPLKTNFAWHKAALEQIADAAIATPSGTIKFAPAKAVGPVQIEIAHRLPSENNGESRWGSTDEIYQTKAYEQSVTSIPIQGFWAHQGYVRDLSRQPGEIEAETFSFEKYSNNHDQEIYYLWDGWYVFQNLID